MKKYMFLLFWLVTLPCSAQEESQFEYDSFESQILAYAPIKRENISDDDFEYGKVILAEIKSAVQGDTTNFGLADYFNALSALITIGENRSSIKTAFEKFEKTEGSCEYVIAFENTIMGNSKFDVVRERYIGKLAECRSNPDNREQPNIDRYCSENDLNCDLVRKIRQINLDDQRYRQQGSIDHQAQQHVLDARNQEAIDALYDFGNDGTVSSRRSRRR